MDNRRDRVLRGCLTCVNDCPCWDKPFELHTDASAVGIGAVLCQKDGKSERVIQYVSRALTPPESRYAVHEQELLAVVWALETCRPYLSSGEPVLIRTDSRAVELLEKKAEGSRRILRWLLRMAEFKYVVMHRKGSQNANADFLSRFPQSGRNEDDQDIRPVMEVQAS